MDDLEEKFTRCPQCRSFSIARCLPPIKKRLYMMFHQDHHYYHCRNCGHDFQQFLPLENRFIKHEKRSFLSGQKKMVGWLLLIMAFCVAWAIYFLTQTDHVGSSKSVPPPVQSTQPPKDVPGNKVAVEPTNPTHDDVKNEIQNIQPIPSNNDASLKSPAPVPLGTIDLAGSARFGVNWDQGQNGLLITRLSDGPLFEAGLLVGDIITHLNNNPIQTDAPLILLRDQLSRGIQSEGLLKVNRKGQILLFSLINSSASSQQVQLPKAILLFKASELKIRSSRPQEESATSRWVFNSTNITAKRQTDQRFYISGKPDLLAPWGVDNILMISKNAIPGLKAALDKESIVIPGQLYREPLDVSDYFPPDRSVQIVFSLVDLGIKWGNTDLYLFIQ